MADVEATFVAEYDYKAQGETELTVNAGDKVRVSRIEGDWLYGRHLGTGKEGWVASSYGHIRQESPYLQLDERSKTQKRVERFQTIVKGESDFLGVLKDLVDNVINVINVRDTSFKRNFLNDPAVAVSFNLLVEIHKACNSFHSVVSNSKNEVDLCTGYTHFAPSLQLFAQYASENSKMLHAVERNRRDLSGLLGEFNLAGALILPLEHYPLYQSDFQDYVWLSSSKSQNYELLCSALDAIIAQSEFVDLKLKEEADSLLLLNLQNMFSGNPVIFTPTRRLLKEAEIEKVREKSTGEIETKLYYAHLFNDALIYSSRSRVTGAFKLHSCIEFKGARFELHEIGGLANGFCIHPGDKGSKVENFRMITKEDALEWFPLIINQIEVLKTKRIERRTSAMVRTAVNIPGVKMTDLGLRGGVMYKFLLSEMQFAEITASLNACMVQPLIDASKGAVLSAAATNTEQRDGAKAAAQDALFDSRAASTTKYQTQVITEALQEPDILIFLRAAEGIALASREFAKVLESLCTAANWKESMIVGNQFTSVNAVALYNQFKSFAAGQQAMMRVLKTPPFAQFYKDCETLLAHMPGNLAEKVELPRKRIKNYMAFVTELLQVTPTSHADHGNASKALSTIESMNAEIEELLRVKKNFESLLSIQASLVTIRNEPVVQKLVTMDRTFIKEGDLKKVCRKKNKTFRFWLFNDFIIYGGALGGEKFSFNRALELHKCSASLHNSTTVKHAIEIFGAEKSFIVIAPTQQSCDDWMEAIQGAIKSIKTAKGLDTAGEAAPLWTPDHTSDSCTVCKKGFTFFIRRHHCRKCGVLMCSDHLNHKEILPHIHKTQKQKICDDCHSGKNVRISEVDPPALTTSPATTEPAAPSSVSPKPAAGALGTKASTTSSLGPKPQWPPQSQTASPAAVSAPAHAPAPAPAPAPAISAKPTWPPQKTETTPPPKPVASRRATSPPPLPSMPPEEDDDLPAVAPPPPPLPVGAPPMDAPQSVVSAAPAKKVGSKFSKRTSAVASKLATAHASKASGDADEEVPPSPTKLVPSTPIAQPAPPATPTPLTPPATIVRVAPVASAPPASVTPPAPTAPAAPARLGPRPGSNRVVPPPPPPPSLTVPGQAPPGPAFPSAVGESSSGRARPPPPPPPSQPQEPQSRPTPPPPPQAPPSRPLSTVTPPPPPPVPVAMSAGSASPPPPPPPPAAQPSAASEPDEFSKYRKMKELLPEGAVRQKMTADGFAAADINDFLAGKVSALQLPGTGGQAVSIATATLRTAQPAVPAPARSNNLLDEILSGPKLKSVQAEPKPAAKLQGAGGILGMLAQEMSKRRINITAAEDSDSDSSGFSDSDSDSD